MFLFIMCVFNTALCKNKQKYVLVDFNDTDTNMGDLEHDT